MHCSLRETDPAAPPVFCAGAVRCSSRKGTIEAAAAIVKEAEAHAQVAAYSATAAAAGSTGSIFVRDRGQLQRLRAAAGKTQAKVLASVLVAGVGFHK